MNTKRREENFSPRKKNLETPQNLFSTSLPALIIKLTILTLTLLVATQTQAQVPEEAIFEDLEIPNTNPAEVPPEDIPEEAPESAATAPSEDIETPPESTLFHIPPSKLRAGKSTQLHAVIGTDWALERTWVGLRLNGVPSRDARARFQKHCLDAGNTLSVDDQDTCEIELKRNAADNFAAPISGQLLQPPGVSYYIASRSDDGELLMRFASPENPWSALIHGQTEETRRLERLARHNGYTSRMRVASEFSAYGETLQPQAMLLPDESARGIDAYSDWFWTTNAEYTYRSLKKLYAFRFGINVMRGSIPEVDGEKIDKVSSSPGMNSGYGELDFELHRNFSAAGRITLGATEEGFTVGIGALARIGPSWGSHLELGFDSNTRLGGRYFMTFAWKTIPKFPMALTVEATQLPQSTYYIETPNGDEVSFEPELGTRMFLDVNYEINHKFSVGVRGGFANRQKSLNSGFVSGFNASLDF